jgi:hypothetical protein
LRLVRGERRKGAAPSGTEDGPRTPGAPSQRARDSRGGRGPPGRSTKATVRPRRCSAVKKGSSVDAGAFGCGVDACTAAGGAAHGVVADEAVGVGAGDLADSGLGVDGEGREGKGRQSKQMLYGVQPTTKRPRARTGVVGQFESSSSP